MTKTKTILGISFAAVFALSMLMVPAYSEGHLSITKTDVKVKTDLVKGTQTMDVKIRTSTNIPTDGSAAGFGFGVITGVNDVGQPENVLAITTHMCAADSLVPGPDGDCSGGTVGVLTALTGVDGLNEAHDGPEFHAHILDLKVVEVGSACDLAYGTAGGLEVDVARSLQGQFGFDDDIETTNYPNNNVLAEYDVKVKKNKIEVKKVPVSDLFDSGVEAIVSFGINGVVSPSDPTLLTNICLT